VFGTLNMLGNVREWTESLGRAPEFRQVKGLHWGSFADHPDSLSNYAEMTGSTNAIGIGFRCAKSVRENDNE